MQRRLCSLPQINSILHTLTSKATQHQLKTASKCATKDLAMIIQRLSCLHTAEISRNFYVQLKRRRTLRRLPWGLCIHMSKIKAHNALWKCSKMSLIEESSSLKSSCLIIKDWYSFFHYVLSHLNHVRHKDFIEAANASSAANEILLNSRLSQCPMYLYFAHSLKPTLLIQVK